MSIDGVATHPRYTSLPTYIKSKLSCIGESRRVLMLAVVRFHSAVLSRKKRIPWISRPIWEYPGFILCLKQLQVVPEDGT